MPNAMVSLDMIGLEAGTDKSSAHHNYLALYERFFDPLRVKPLKLLEIGVFRGASLKAWERYFPNASIVGADINREVEKFSTLRTTIAIIDQSNLQDLVDLGIKHGPFDIVIEDGSHLWEHQITTLKTLFPFVANGGYYVVEDLQTSFGNLVKDYQGVSQISCVEYLKKLVDFHVGDEEVNISTEEDPFLRTYGRALDFITLSRHVCIIKKKMKTFRGSSFITTPLVPHADRDRRLPIKLLAHIGNFGDVMNSDDGFITVDEANNTFIQGFQIYILPEFENQLEYRCRGMAGDWTDWQVGNRFAGSRGKNDSLTGITVRISGILQQKYDLQVVGHFRGDTEVVVVGDGEVCQSMIAGQPMRGMQIRLLPKVL